MSKKKLISSLKDILKTEKKALDELNNKITTQELSMNNKKLFKYLSKAGKLKENIETVEESIKILQKQLRYKLMITVKSKVQLVSTKFGAVMWVEAKNYLDLVGNKVGDIVMMQNSQFLIAGVY